MARRPDYLRRQAVSVRSPGRLTLEKLLLYAVAALLLLPLLIGGGLYLARNLILPAVRIAQARDWEPVPCRIVSTAPRIDGRGSVSFGIQYRYRYKGERYTGSRLAFLELDAHDQHAVREILPDLRNGAGAICYVNPRNPAEAVLHRGFVERMRQTLLISGLGGVVLAAGLLVLKRFGLPTTISGATSRFLTTGTSTDPNRPGYPHPALADEPRAIRLRSVPINWIATVLLLVLTPGLLYVTQFFSLQTIQSAERGRLHPIQLSILFVLLAFSGILLAALLKFVVTLLFQPRPKLTLSRPAIPVGGQARLDWKFAGRPRRIKSVQFSLVGLEDDVGSERGPEVFCRRTLLQSRDPDVFSRGTLDVVVPEGTMHSLALGRHRIRWMIEVVGEGTGRVPLHRQFTIEVTPRP